MIEKIKIITTVLLDRDEPSVNFKVEALSEHMTGKLNLSDIAKLLSGALVMTIKGCNKDNSGYDDHEIMKECIDILNKEFSDINSFNDFSMQSNLYKERNDDKN